MTDKQMNELVSFLLAGDENSSWSLICNLIEDKDSFFFFEDILTRSMRYIGELWENNDISVADEHVASNICNLLISRYNFQSNNETATLVEGKPKAMLFCIQGEEHSIGMKMVSSIFKENGYDTRYLGANLPIKDSIIYANIWRPDIIGISLSIIYNLPTLLECLKKLNQLDYNPEIIVGGRITSLYQLKSYCPSNVVVIEGLYHLRSWLKENKLCERVYVYN